MGRVTYISQAFAAGIGGLFVAIVGASAIIAALAALPPTLVTYTSIAAFVLLWAVSIYATLSAWTASEAWRRLALFSAPFLLSLPLSIALYMLGLFTIDVEATGLITAITRMLVGGGFGSFVFGSAGFFLGFLFLGIGLLFGNGK